VHADRIGRRGIVVRAGVAPIEIWRVEVVHVGGDDRQVGQALGGASRERGDREARGRERARDRAEERDAEGRQADAERAMAQLLEVDPSLRAGTLRQRFPIKRDEDFAQWEEGLRKAGLPG
jgi:hypothetical protein